MFKFIFAALLLTPFSAHAASVSDASFRQVIEKHVAKETAQEALKVALAVRAEQKIARKKKVR